MSKWKEGTSTVTFHSRQADCSLVSLTGDFRRLQKLGVLASLGTTR